MLLLLKIQYTAKAPEGNMIEECLFYKRGYEIMIGWLTFCELITLVNVMYLLHKILEEAMRNIHYQNLIKVLKKYLWTI